MQRFQVLTDRVEQTEEQRLLSINQLSLQASLSLSQGRSQMLSSLIDCRYVDQGRILELKVFLQIVHFVRDLVQLGDAVFAEIVH